MRFFDNSKSRFVEKYLWLLLPILFFILFVPENSTGITNLYRLLIVLPLLFCARTIDIKALWDNSSARWMLLLCGWMLASLFFDGYIYKDLKLFWRLLNFVGLFYLVFLYSRYHDSRISRVQPFLLLFGVVGSVLILSDWQGLRYFDVNKNYYVESSRGIFDHHLEVGWAMALLGIVALNQFLGARNGYKASLGAALFVFFSVVVLFVQARGGYVLFAVGSVLLLFFSPGKRAQWTLVGSTLLLMLSFILFRDELLTLWRHALDRGTAGRYPIWNNGVHALSESVWSLLFGHGLSANTENMVGNFQAAHFHNFFLNHTFYTGLIGLFLYLGLVFSALRKSFSSRQSVVWGVLVLAMQIAFITDGDRLVVNPSSMMLCFLFPLAMASFSPASDAARWYVVVPDRKHIAICVLTGLALMLAVYGLSRDALKAERSDYYIGASMPAVVINVPESGVISMKVDRWPPPFGSAMPVAVAGIERPLPWKYKCDYAVVAWREGRNYLRQLFAVNRDVELRNIVRQKQTQFFRLEADILSDGRSVADELVKKGFASRPGEGRIWCP